MNIRNLLIVCITAVLCACNPNNQTGGNGVTEPVNMHLSPAQVAMTTQSNSFSIGLLQKVYTSEEASENVVLSPLSASMALGMVMNGADGNTLRQMQEALGFCEETTMEDINAYYQTLIKALPALDQSNTLRLANSIWVNSGYQLKDAFLQTNQEYFSATARNVDFCAPATAGIINGWASDNTNRLIEKVVEANELCGLQLLLANALYFKGIWAIPFDKKQTYQDNFQTAAGQSVKADYMCCTDGYGYYEDEALQIVELPYKEDKYCMDILLPAKDKTIKDLLSALEAGQWAGYIKGMQSREVMVTIPKFRLSYGVTLNDVLQEMGMKDAFNPFTADFSQMSETPLCISDVKQVCQINVDEEGTEAAAVTTVGMYDTAILGKSFKADRPFLFIIREKQYGTILFASVLGNPC